jgi:hypothetical protein
MVPEFLAEQYEPGAVEADVRQRAAALQRVCLELGASDIDIRVVFARYVPADEVVFVDFEAESREAIYEAARQVGIAFDRVSETLNALSTAVGTDQDITDQNVPDQNVPDQNVPAENPTE